MTESQTTVAPLLAKRPADKPLKRHSRERFLAPLLLSPSIIALLVFVYGFIGTTIYISMSQWNTARISWALEDPFYKSFQKLFLDRRFQGDLRNTLVFTVFFLFLAIVSGLILAILLDRHVIGRPFFRNVFLFPYALSFIVTGVAWRWIFNPATGVNLLFDTIGLNRLLVWLGYEPFKPGWITDSSVILQINGFVDMIPGGDYVKTNMGIPVAIIPVTIAATWQLAGFAMAMYLAGLGTISNEVREAAELDGASTYQVYRHIVIPLLTPITVSTMIILGHVSLKIYDLIVAMTGGNPKPYLTDMPGIYVVEQSFKAQKYNLGASAAVVMLILVTLVIVPYLRRTLKELH